MGTTKQSQAQLRPVDLEKYEYVQGIRPDTWMNPKSKYAGSTGARSFDGEQYVDLDTGIAVGASDSFWISFWVKRPIDGKNDSYIVTLNHPSGATGGVYVRCVSDEIYVRCKGNNSAGPEGYLTSGNAIPKDGSWRHVVITCVRGGNATCYVNGVAQDTFLLATWTAAITVNETYPGCIAARHDGTSAFEGDLSKIAYGTGLLTADEITELYNKGEGLLRVEYSSSLAAKTVHSWNCNEAPEELLYDSTGDNHGTPAIPTTNLVSNGTFESVTFGDPDDWTISQGDGDSYAVMDTESHAGEMSMKMFRGDGDAEPYIYQTGFTEGHYGTLTFWAKTESGTPNVRVYGGSGGTTQDIEITDEWDEYTVSDFAIGSNEYIRLRPVTTDVAIWFDDISFVRTGPDVSSVTTSLELGARSFDGEQFVKLTSGIASDVGALESCWLSVWVKQELGSGNATALEIGRSVGSYGGIRLNLWDDDIKVYIGDTDANRVNGDLTSSNAAPDDGTWRHIIIQFVRGGNLVCYIGGELAGSLDASSVTGVIEAEARYFGCIGSDYNEGGKFTGDLSKIAYGTGLLDTDDIAELYNSGRGITKVEYSSGLAAKTTHSWDCNEGPGDSLYDSTGTNDGTPVVDDSDLVTNGGFEDRTGDDFDDWAENSAGSSEIVAETSDAQSGNVSCRVNVVDGSNAYLTQDAVTIGNTYTATFQAKTSDVSKQLNFGIGTSEGHTLTTDWAEYEITRTCSNNNAMYVGRWTSSGDYSLYIDSISVVRTGPHVGSTRGPEAQELISNGGFDSGDNWSTTGCSIAGGKVTFTESGQNCDQTGRSFVGGQDYQVTLEIEDYTGRAVALGVGSYGFEDLPIDGNGTWTFTKTAIAPGTILRLRGAAGLEGETIAVTNVSVVRADGLGGRNFDGSQYFELGSDIDPGTDDFWLSAWVNTANLDTYRGIIRTGGHTDSKAGFFVWVNDNGRLLFSMSDGSTRVAGDISDSAVDDGIWHHVVILADRSGDATCYVDNSLQTITKTISTANGNVTTSSGPYIGTYTSSIYPFNGSLSKIAYGTGLLDTDDIAELYNDGVGITKVEYSSGLAAKTTYSWDCNEGPGDSLYDSTGTNDGTPAIDDSDLVTNGGFESRGADDFDDWVENASGASTITAETTDVQSGTASCAINIVDSAFGGITLSDKLTIGNTYELSGYAKSSVAGRAIKCDSFSGNPYTAFSTTWNTFSLEGTSDLEGIVIARYSGGDYSIYLDDISVIRTGPHVGSTEGPETAKILDSISTNHGTPVNMDVSNVSDDTPNGIGQKIAYDSVGSNNGALMNYGDTDARSSTDIPAALAGTGVKSMSFDGVDEYVNCGNPTSLQLKDDFSWCVWFKTTVDNSTDYGIFGRGEVGSAALKWMLYIDNGTVECKVRTDANYINLDSAIDVKNGEWHFAAVTYNYPTLTLYVDDNVPVSETLDSDVQFPNSQELVIGTGADDAYFPGSVADPRVYNTVLTPAEVAQLYAGTDVTDGLVSRWKFDEDPVSLSDVKSLTFDGVEEYVDCGNPTSLQLEDDFSWCAWVKTTLDSSSSYQILGRNTTSGTIKWGIYLQSEKAKAIVYSETDGIQVVEGTDINDGEWHFICTIYNAPNLILYVDSNSPITNTSAAGGIYGPSVYDIFIGRGFQDIYFPGSVADPRVYNTVLTPTEVAQLAAGTDVTRGLVSRWKFNDNWSEGVSNDDPIVALESRSGNQIYLQPTSSKRPLYIEGPPESIQFDGNDYLSSSNVITAESGVFAANCYFPSGDYSIISQSVAGSGEFYFDIGVSDGIVQVKHKNNDDETLVYGETDISNDWHCVVVTSDGSNYGIRVDQSQESLTGDNDGHWFGNLDQKDTLTLGANIIDSTGTPASGNISDVVIFNNPISSGYLLGLEKNMMKIGGFYT
jgi:hypothetical protein